MKRCKSIALVAMTLALVGAVIAGSCAPVKPVEREGAIKVGLDVGLTGPIATTTFPMSVAMFGYFKELNERGGINGVPVDFMWEDSQYLPAKSFMAVKKLIDKGAIAAATGSSAGADILAPVVAKRKVPLIQMGSFTDLLWTTPEQWVFASEPGGGPAFATYVEWIREGWKETRLPRVGVIILDSGTGWYLVEGAKRTEELGLYEFIGHEVLPFPVVLDTSVEWLRLASEEPDWIICYSFGSPAVTMIKDAARVDIQGKGIKLAGYIVPDDTLLPAVGPEDMEGWMATRTFATPQEEAEWSGMKAALAEAKKYQGWGPDKVSYLYLIGRNGAFVLAQALKETAERVGLENLTSVAMT